jgi:hypothetical protein
MTTRSPAPAGLHTSSTQPPVEGKLPYLRAWAEKYADHELVVIGVHTPEFGFEHNRDSVSRALQEMGIDYPVAIDNDHAVWSAFDNLPRDHDRFVCEAVVIHRRATVTPWWFNSRHTFRAQ